MSEINELSGLTMNEDAKESTNGSTLEDPPKFHLYVRASLIDNETQGACPMSQQGFMLCYLLAQEGNIDFKVWTVSQVNPPKIFQNKMNLPKFFPFVEGISGKDANGQSIAGMTPESSDLTDDFFESVNFDCPLLKRPRNITNHILGKINGISTAFNSLLKGIQKETVTNILKKVDNYLETEKTKFLDGDILSYTDCFLLPRLQHIIVAGKYYRNYQIPSSMKNVWRYLRDAYELHAFKDTIPTDADLCKFHWVRFSDTLTAEFRKNKISDRFGVHFADAKTTEIPEDIAAMLSSDGKEEEEEEEEVQRRDNGDHNGDSSEQRPDSGEQRPDSGEQRPGSGEFQQRVESD